MSIRAAQKQQTRQALIDAALHLSFRKGSFVNISLREIAQTVHIVPAAFYRHFADMDQLGLELIDRVSVYIRHIFHQLGKASIENPDSSAEQRLDFLFHSIDQYPEIWHFFMAERLSGNLVLRHAMQREHLFLLQEFTQRMFLVPHLKKICEIDLAPSLSSLYLQSTFHWAIQRIEMNNTYQDNELKIQQARLRHSALKQIRLLYLAVEA